MVHTFTPKAQEAKAGGPLGVQDQAGIHSKILCQPSRASETPSQTNNNTKEKFCAQYERPSKSQCIKQQEILKNLFSEWIHIYSSFSIP